MNFDVACSCTNPHPNVSKVGPSDFSRLLHEDDVQWDEEARHSGDCCTIKQLTSGYEDRRILCPLFTAKVWRTMNCHGRSILSIRMDLAKECRFDCHELRWRFFLSCGYSLNFRSPGSPSDREQHPQLGYPGRAVSFPDRLLAPRYPFVCSFAAAIG